MLAPHLPDARKFRWGDAGISTVSGVTATPLSHLKCYLVVRDFLPIRSRGPSLRHEPAKDVDVNEILLRHAP